MRGIKINRDEAPARVADAGAAQRLQRVTDLNEAPSGAVVNLSAGHGPCFDLLTLAVPYIGGPVAARRRDAPPPISRRNTMLETTRDRELALITGRWGAPSDLRSAALTWFTA